MNIAEYQMLAHGTHQQPAARVPKELVPLLGLVGEAGDLLSEYKKHLRDGPAHSHFIEQLGEELGDILWYTAEVATQYDLNLATIAEQNLAKCKDRFSKSIAPSEPRFFDEDSPESQRIPRKMVAEFRMVNIGGREMMRLSINGEERGDPLTDNSHEEDGYRFHDVIHLAFAAVLGWSPVLRKLLGVKRKHEDAKDENEDGARARVLEEGISAIVFRYAERHSFLDGVHNLDADLLKMIRYATTGLEVDQLKPSTEQR